MHQANIYIYKCMGWRRSMTQGGIFRNILVARVNKFWLSCFRTSTSRV